MSLTKTNHCGFPLIIKSARKIQIDSGRHEGKFLMLSLALDLSCADIRPKTFAATTQRMPNQENLKEMRLEKYN